MQKEAKARIRINDLLQRSGWRFFDDQDGPANVTLEAHVKLKKKVLDALGDDFEKTAHGFVDYLLLDDRGFPVAVLEAKAEKYEPLVGKEQARKYARSQAVRFVILSNGNLHYFWDLEQGNRTSGWRRRASSSACVCWTTSSSPAKGISVFRKPG